MIVFQGYSNVLNVDSRETILWTRLETLEANEFPSNFENDESLMSGVSPILLILGYGFGVQVWLFLILKDNSFFSTLWISYHLYQ